VKTMKTLRTVIIEDERYACERLKKLLTPFSQIQLIDFFTNSRQGLDCIQKQQPELIFLDVELENNISAFDIITGIYTNLYRPYIVLVTAHPHYSIKAIKNGVFDYILKPVDVDELEDTIERLVSHISIQSGQVIREYDMLSNREAEVLRYVLEGKNSKEIAELLYISINTVHTHRRNILKKTGSRSVLDLLRTKNKAND
jgi:DNA-binding NarL/FixJ family response regulator